MAVNLPTVGNQIVTSTAPQSSVSRGDIEQNANLMAGALGKVADTTMDIATDMAKTQAADDLQNQKVTLNADGSVNVLNPANSIIFGRAGDAYHAAVQAGTIAQHSNVISSEMNDLHQQNPTDPAAFNAAADAWKTQYLSQHGGGEVGQAISQQADQLQTQHSNSITNTAGTNDLKQQNSSLSAAQESARNDVSTMLRGGANLSDPAVQARISAYDATTEARAANPLFGYSKEQAQLDRDTFHSEAAASRFLYQNDQIYKDQGPNGGAKAALANAQDILSNPAYKLSESERDQYYHKAVGEIRANEAIRKQDIGDARAAERELSLTSASGGRVDSNDVEQVAGAYRAAGSPGDAARVYSSFIRKPLNDDFGRQPLATQTQQLTALQGANAAAQAHAFFISKGYTPEQSAGIVGNLVHESGVNPNSYTPNDAGTGPSAGIAQFHAERLTALKAYAASVGKPANDFQTQLGFIDKELHTTESGTLAKLQGAKTPEQAAAAFIDYERPSGWSPQNPAGGMGYQSRINLARSVYNGKPADMSMGPAGTAWLAANRANEVDDAATKQWKAVMADYGKDQTRPSLQTVNDVVNAARTTRNAALLDTISHDTERMDLSGQFSNMSLPDQHAQLTSMKSAGERGELQPGVAATMKDLQSRSDAITKGLNENPIATAADNFPNKIKPQPPLDFSTDQSLAAGLGARGKVAQFAAQNWQTPPLSALDKADVEQVQGMLANPDPTVKGRVFNALSTLPEDVRNATLAKIGSGRPDLMVSVAAGSMMKAAPDVAASIIRGQQAAKTNPEFMPKGSGEEAALATEMDRRLPVSTFSLAARTDASGPYAVAQGMIKARYADLSAQSADASGKLNTDRLQQATDDVTGGILDHNGGKLIAPVRGMPQSVFDRTMAGITDADLGNAAVVPATPESRLAANQPFVKAGDQQYSTKLAPSDETSFRDWAAKNKVPFDPENKQSDYDMRGYWKVSQDPAAWKALQSQGKIPSDMEPAGTKVDPNDGKPHYPDYWKTPYHETFSNESQWANDKAPHWTDDDKLVTPDGRTVFDDRAVAKSNPQSVTTLNGAPVTADYLRNNATLESVGDGRYYVKLGKDPLRPVYAYQGANTEMPQKFMLDLRNRPMAAPAAVAYAAPVLQ
jgi:hypothetical protein